MQASLYVLVRRIPFRDEHSTVRLVLIGHSSEPIILLFVPALRAVLIIQTLVPKVLVDTAAALIGYE